MPKYRSDLHRLNAEAKAMTPAQRRQMVEDARLLLGEAAAQALAVRFGVSPVGDLAAQPRRSRVDA